MAMYLKDKTKRITVRLSEKQYEHLELLSEMMEMSKVDIIRCYIDKSMGAKLLNDNKQTNKHNQL